jgi:hypothetical protein
VGVAAPKKKRGRCVTEIQEKPAPFLRGVEKVPKVTSFTEGKIDRLGPGDSMLTPGHNSYFPGSLNLSSTYVSTYQ